MLARFHITLFMIDSILWAHLTRPNTSQLNTQELNRVRKQILVGIMALFFITLIWCMYSCNTKEGFDCPPAKLPCHPFLKYREAKVLMPPL